MNRKVIFDNVRGPLFGGSLNNGQVEGIEIILDAMAGCDARWIAYALATAYHETAYTMQPIKERGGNAYFTRLYDPTGERPALARKMGNTTPGDGPKYCGRGFVQLTWKTNYAKASEVVGADLVANPDRAMEPAVAAKIMRHGMERGWFTGKKLADYFGAETDWREARRIINGLDKADLIAGHAKNFWRAIDAAEKALPEPKPTPPATPVAPAPSGGWWQSLKDRIKGQS